jgi:hypothetical protein
MPGGAIAAFANRAKGLPSQTRRRPATDVPLWCGGPAAELHHRPCCGCATSASLLVYRLRFRRRVRSIRDIAVVLKLHFAYRAARFAGKKLWAAGNFCNRSPVSSVAGWAYVAPDSPSPTGETHRGAFGQTIFVRIGLCSRGVDATINYRRSNCVEPMGEGDRHSHSVNSRHRFGAGARK